MKVTPDQVREIYHDQRHPKHIAEDYNIHISHVRKIKNRDTRVSVDVSKKPKTKCQHKDIEVLKRFETNDKVPAGFFRCKNCGKELFWLENNKG